MLGDFGRWCRGGYIGLFMSLSAESAPKMHPDETSTHKSPDPYCCEKLDYKVYVPDQPSNC